MGGSSTSQSAVLDSKSGQKKTSYDLRSWQGLTEVLKDAKESLRGPEAYAEFRNIVLAYAKEGGDPTLKERIDAVIATFKNPTAQTEEQRASTQEEVRTKDTFALGGRRMQPRFVSSARFIKNDSAVSAQNREEKLPPQASVPPPPPKPQKSDEQSRDPMPVVPQETVVVPEKKVPEPPRAVETGMRTLEAYKNRITEIKRTVHEQVGNPAALIDTHNETGKRYMVALLNALKATGGGGTVGADSAMLALEDAFKALTESPVSSVKQKPTEVPIIEETSREKENVAKESAPADLKPESRSETKVVPPLSLQKETVRKTEEEDELKFPPPRKEVKEEEPSGEVKEDKVQFEKSIFAQDILKVPEKKTQDTNEEERGYVLKDSDQVVTNVLKKQAVAHSPRSALISALEDDDLDISTETQAQVRSQKDTSPDVAEAWDEAIPAQLKHAKKGLGAQSLEEVKQESGIDPKDVAVRQTELFTGEITEALRELLHEWRIFSSSGLFGTGPGGLEHPLYMQLAPLSMGEVIAGRWEGSNPKVQKAIKEYIDAWRHEQGIAYTINETFEHYLRRVLQKILKRQKQSMGL